MVPNRCLLTSFPLEVFNNIVLELTKLQPLGPPSILIPLMQTCRTIHDVLQANNNPHLYAAIFRHKFDTGAISRRAFNPTPVQYTDQLQRVVAAMSLFRSENVFADDCLLSDELRAIGLKEALRIAFVMLLEDDGRNAAQLLQWARADVFVKKLVMNRLYEDSQDNEGWPLDNDINAHALWVMWLLTSEESLLQETPQERTQIQQLLMPFVYLPARYAVSSAPPNHFIVPPINEVNTTSTPHGHYPVYRDPLRDNIVFFDARFRMHTPSPAIAAKLLFMARSEVTPMPIAEHFYRTRADRHAQGIFEVGPTRENIEEINWGWCVYPPLGTGLHTRSGARKSIGEWRGLEWDTEDEEQERFPQRLKVYERPGFEAPPPVPKWEGKAPHATAAARGITKSQKWDMDWMRARFCGNPYTESPRVPYGKVYEPGAINGLWQGTMLLPGFDRLKDLFDNPFHPPHGSLTEESLSADRRPVFFRLREMHGVEGESFPLSDFVDDAADTNSEDNGAEFDIPFFDPGVHHDGMMNAWFSGNKAPVLVEREDGQVLVRVGKEAGIYRYRPAADGAQRGGNDAYSSSEMEAGELLGTTQIGNGSGEFKYEHDTENCLKCRDLKAFRKLMNQLGIPESQEVFNENDEDDLLSPWDPEDGEMFAPILNQDGNPLPSSSLAHDWDRRGRGTCDGIRDIIIVGELDPEHAAAFGDFNLYGRVRRWDGMVLLLRVPKHDANLGTTLFFGHIVGGDTIIGNWRWGGTDPGRLVWEGTFAVGRRLD